MTRKFKDHPNAQACVIENEDGYKALQSYQTIVAEVDAEGWLRINGLYSATTRKHIGWFVRELGIKYQPYQLAKQLYNDHAQMNVYTGEVIFNVR